MTATTDVEFKLTVNAAQAQAELEKTRQSAVSLSGGYDSLTASTRKLAAASADYAAKGMASYEGLKLSGNRMNADLVAGYQNQTKSFFTLTGAGREFQKNLGPQAAAISSISNALGQQNSQAGKAIQIAGQLAAAFAAGGPLGLAMAAAGAGVVALEKHWDDLIEKEEEALRLQYDEHDRAAALLQKARADVADLQVKQLTRTGQAYAAVTAEINKVKEAEDALISKAGKAGGFTEQEKGAITFYDETLKLLEKKRAMAQAAAQGAFDPADKVEPIKVIHKTGSFSEDDFFLAKYGIDAAEYRNAAATAFEADAKAQNERDKITMLAIKENADGDLEIQKRLANAKSHLRELEFEETQRKLQEELAMRKAIAAEVVGIGVNASQELIDGLITGQKDALAHFAASIFKQAGTAMIGHGIDAAAGGIAMLSLGNPAGAVPLATGGALIAGGLALGGVSAGIEHSLAGGTVGQALPDKGAARASTNPGINTGSGARSGGSGGQQQLVVNVTYGAAGPAPQDTGRAVADALQAFGRSSGLSLAGPNAQVQGPRR